MQTESRQEGQAGGARHTHIDDIDVQDALSWGHQGKVDDVSQGPHRPVGQQGRLQLGLDCRHNLLARPATSTFRTRPQATHLVTQDATTEILPACRAPATRQRHIKQNPWLQQRQGQEQACTQPRRAAETRGQIAATAAVCVPAALQVGHGSKKGAGHQGGHAHLVQ